MGWHKRGSGRYFYRSQRHGESIEKLYIGGGPVGEWAAQTERLRQYEKEQDRLQWEQQKQCIEEAIAAFKELDSGTELIRDALLLVAGFHRAERHPWRVWRDGRRVLNQHD